MIEVPIKADDRERIDAMCAQYRNQIENLYNIAYLQGQIDQAEADRDKLRKENA